jgi:hypothetical protein
MEMSERALRPAIEELAFATALDAADGDSQRPKVVWGFTAPRTWLGHAVPGSRWGIDNPDNVYRIIPVDGNSKYEISVRSHAPGPIQYSFLVYDSFVGEEIAVSAANPSRAQSTSPGRWRSWFVVGSRRSVMSLCLSRIRGLGLPHALCQSQRDGVTG